MDLEKRKEKYSMHDKEVTVNSEMWTLKQICRWKDGYGICTKFYSVVRSNAKAGKQIIIADTAGEKLHSVLGCVLFCMAQQGNAFGFNKAIEIMKVNQTFLPLSGF